MFALTRSDARFSLETLEEVYVAFIENKRLRRTYSRLNLEALERQLQQSTDVKVQFYLMQSRPALPPMPTHSVVAMHNYISFLKSKMSPEQLLEACKGIPKD